MRTLSILLKVCNTLITFRKYSVFKQEKIIYTDEYRTEAATFVGKTQSQSLPGEAPSILNVCWQFIYTGSDTKFVGSVCEVPHGEPAAGNLSK